MYAEKQIDGNYFGMFPAPNSCSTIGRVLPEEQLPKRYMIVLVFAVDGNTKAMKFVPSFSSALS